MTHSNPYEFDSFEPDTEDYRDYHACLRQLESTDETDLEESYSYLNEIDAQIEQYLDTIGK